MGPNKYASMENAKLLNEKIKLMELKDNQYLKKENLIAWIFLGVLLIGANFNLILTDPKPRLEYYAWMIGGSWDDTAIQRVVENLVNNAAKYGDPKSLVNVKLFTENNQVVISVHNFGNPLSTHDQNTIFDLHHRTTTAEKGSHKGWGLGLTLVRGLVEAHQGQVSVQSSKDVGTTFTVRLPLY